MSFENKKRILFMYWHNFENRDMGTNVRVNDIVAQLHNFGFEIDLYAITGMGYDFTDFENKSKYISNLYTTDISICQNNQNSHRKDILNDFVTEEMEKRFYEIIKDRDYSYIATVYLAQAKLLKTLNMQGCKKIYFFEDSLAIAENLNGKQLGKCIEDEIRRLQFFDRIAYISSDEKIFYERFCKNQEHIHIPSFFSERKKVDKVKYDVTFIGHDNKFNIEGIKWFFDNVYEYLDRKTTIRIAGKVSKYVNEDYPNVTKEGFIENIEDVYNETKIIICPMLNGTGLKIKVLEAMSYGIPVVCTIRGVDGFADKNELGCLVTDKPYNFAEYITRLLNDSVYFRQKETEIKNYYRKYLSNNVNSKLLLSIFSDENIKIIENKNEKMEDIKLKINYKFHEKYTGNYGCKIYANGAYIKTLCNGSDYAEITIDNKIVARNSYLRLLFKCNETVNGGCGEEDTCIKVEKIESDKNCYNIDFKYGAGRYWIRGWHNSDGKGRWSWGNESYISIYKENLKVTIIAVKDENESDENYIFTLNSILNSDYEHVEIIAPINKNNIDETSKLIINNLNGIIVESEGNSIPELINAGLSKATGDYILIIKSGEAISKSIIKDSISNIIHNDYDYVVFNGMDMSYDNIFNTIDAVNDKENAVFKKLLNSLCGVIISSNIVNKLGFLDNHCKEVYSYKYLLSILMNKIFKGGVVGDIAGYYIKNTKNYYGPSFKKEILNVFRLYNNELLEDEIESLADFILFSKNNDKTANVLNKMYYSEFYSEKQKHYFVELAERNNILLMKNIEMFRLENENIKNNRWYRFGQKNRKEKINTIVNYFFRKFFKISINNKSEKYKNVKCELDNYKGREIRAIKDNKLLLIYDVSYIAMAYGNNTNRTGLFMVCYYILLGLMNSKEIKVLLYAEEQYIDNAKKVLQKEGFDINKTNFINEYDKKYFLDVLQTADIYFSPLYAVPEFIHKYEKIKKYLIVHDLIPYIYPEFFPDMTREDYWFKKIVKNGNNFDINYITVSENTKKDLIKYGNIPEKKIRVIYNAIANKFKRCNDNNIAKIKNKYGIGNKSKYIFSLCTLEPRKNLIFAVKCFIKFIEKYNIEDLYLALAGSQWDFFIEQLDKEIDNCNEYKNKILKLGYVEDEDLPALYSGSEFFIYPSLYEGFGLPPLEAMACGTPVIVSNTSSMPEVCGDAAIYINPSKEEDLIKAMEELYFDENKRLSMIQKSLENAKRFSWDKTVNKIVDLLKENN